jgi:hypothetical protein
MLLVMARGVVLRLPLMLLPKDSGDLHGLDDSLNEKRLSVLALLLLKPLLLSLKLLLKLWPKGDQMDAGEVSCEWLREHNG